MLMMPSAQVLAEVRRRIGELDDEAAQLVARWQEVTARKNRFQVFLDVWGELNPASSADGEPNPLIEEIRDHKLADAAEIIMERAGGQVSMVQMVDLLRQAGIVNTAKKQTAYSSVLKTLQRHMDRFYRVREGFWGLTKYRRDALPELTTGTPQ
jgi:hypothetical protein